MQNGTYFHVTATNPSPTPFTLSPDQTMTVTISDTLLSKFLQTDSLMIETSHNLLTTAFQIQGVRLAPSGVANELPKDVAISVLPNPASSYVLIKMAGIRSADIQIFDLLGKEVASAKANSFWKWDASNNLDGSYIARISGESAGEEHFTASKRIILSK